jgi:peptidoglycan/LPS O-acetylase OafA/YrhL
MSVSALEASSRASSSIERRTLLRPLTGLRFFAAIYVVLYHYVQEPLKGAPDAIRSFVSHGFVGPCFFFCLSGFILSYNYLREDRINARSFWVARWGRIYPAYALSLVLAFPFFVWPVLHGGMRPSEVGVFTFNVALCLFLVQGWLPWTETLWNVPAWSLSAEALLYALFPFLAPALARQRLRVVGLVMLVSLAWFGLIAWYCLSPAHHVQPASWSVSWPYRWAWSWPVAFIWGIGVALVFLRGRTVPAPSLLAWLAVGVMLVVLCLDWSRVPTLSYTWPLICIPVFSLVILGLAHERGRLASALSRPVLVFLGDISYGVYILQYPLGLLVTRAARLVHLPLSGWDGLPLSVAICISILGAAAASYIFWETPARRFVRRAAQVQRATCATRERAD